MNDSLASYWNTPVPLGALSLPLLAEGRDNRETVSVLVYNMGPGEHSIFGRHPQKAGQQEE